jgi:hypothetical protein
MLKINKKFVSIIFVLFSSLSVFSAFMAININNEAIEIDRRIVDKSIPIFSWNIVKEVSEFDYLNLSGLKYNQKALSIYYYSETYYYPNNQEDYILQLLNTCLARFNNILTVTASSYYDNKEFALNSYSNCFSWEKDRGSVFSFEINTPNNNVYKIALLETLVQINRERNYYIVRRLKVQENDGLVELDTGNLLYWIGKTNYLKFSSNTNLKSSFISKSSFSFSENQRIDSLESLQTDLSIINLYEFIYISLSIFFGVFSTTAIYLYLYIGKFPFLHDAITFNNLMKKKKRILRRKLKTHSESVALSKLKDLEKEIESLK